MFSASLTAAEEIGRVTVTEGRVDVTRLPDNEAVLLADGAPVFIGDSIRAKDHSKAEIEFVDKSVVKIAPNTRIEIKDFAVKGTAREHAEIYIARGKIFADVSRAGKPGTFIITTPNARGSVRGTEVIVLYQAERTSALVRDGRLSICNIALPDQKEEIAAGEAIMVPFNSPPEKSRPYMDAEFAIHEQDTKPTYFQAVSLGKETAKMKGVVTAMAGSVRVLKKGASGRHSVKLNEILDEGDKIETEKDGRVSILFENGNVLDLQADSRILLATLQRDPRTGEFDNTFESDEGRIKAVVEKLGKKSAFRVKTPSALCGVRGTVMYVNVTAGSTQAFYEGGGGIVTNPVSGNTTLVESGQNTVSTIAGTISTPTITPADTNMKLDASYNYGVVQDNYTAPENAATNTGKVAEVGGAISVDTAAFLNTGTEIARFNPPQELVPVTEASPSSLTKKETSEYSGC